MCSKYKDYRRYIATYTNLNNRTLSLDRDIGFYNSSSLYKGLLPQTKKTKRTIPSVELSIVRLEPNYIDIHEVHHLEDVHEVHHLETSKVLYKTERDAGTTSKGSKRHDPPPSKGFSDSKDFQQYGIFNISCRYSCICW